MRVLLAQQAWTAAVTTERCAAEVRVHARCRGVVGVAHVAAMVGDGGEWHGVLLAQQKRWAERHACVPLWKCDSGGGGGECAIRVHRAVAHEPALPPATNARARVRDVCAEAHSRSLVAGKWACDCDGSLLRSEVRSLAREEKVASDKTICGLTAAGGSKG